MARSSDGEDDSRNPFAVDRASLDGAPGSATGNGHDAASALSTSRASDHTVGLVVVGLVVAAILVIVLLAMPQSRAVTGGDRSAGDGFSRLIDGLQDLLMPSSRSLPVMLVKLALAALLGGVIGYRQRAHLEEHIVQAHLIVAFTGALMIMIIGNEIVRAFGLLGASSIIRFRTPLRDPKALATLLVSMAVGIAVGAGLFELALVATIMIVALQGSISSVTGRLLPTLYNPQRSYILTLTTADGNGTMLRLERTFEAHGIRSELLEYDARAGKREDLARITLEVEAAASLTRKQLTQLVFRDGVQSVSWAKPA